MTPSIAACCLLILIEAVSALPAHAGCSIERSAAEASRFLRRAGADCTEQERDANPVHADELLAALQRGQAVDLAGVVVQGELDWDRLPAVSLTAADLPGPVVRRVTELRMTDVRLVRAPLRIVHSRIRGSIGTRRTALALAMLAAVDLTGTVFEGPADFSRATFVGPVTAAGTTFAREAYFIQDDFQQPARFKRAAFGTHTRFHRAVFADTVTFAQAEFRGLTEFLEATFEKDADFSHAAFHLGTGFSGSRFAGQASFAETTFEREAFFLFTLFEQRATFRHATFRNVADFSDAQFTGGEDFANAAFDTAPRLTRTRLSGSPPSAGGPDARVFYLVAAILAGLTLIVVFVLRKG